MTLLEFIYFFGYASFGQLISIMLEQVKHSKKIKTYGGFSIKIWLYENWKRGFLTILLMSAGVLFSEQLLGIKLTPFLAFLSGFTTDKTMDAIVNRKA